MEKNYCGKLYREDVDLEMVKGYLKEELMLRVKLKNLLRMKKLWNLVEKGVNL
jgi:hypothetical protein